MKVRSSYSNVGILMVAVGAVVTFSAVVFVVVTPQQPPAISEAQPSIVLEALAKTELAQLAASGMIHPDTVVALGSELAPEAADAVRATSMRWSQETDWPENQGIPPPGTALVRQLGFNGNQGFVTVVVGEVAGSLGCGITVESYYVWRDGWHDRSVSMTMC